jgi:hypothetical protein
MSSPIKFAGAALLAVATLAACSDSSGPANAGRQVAFQLATRSATAAPGAALMAGSETIGLGDDTIVVTQVQLVLREIELKRVGGVACDTIADDDCEELEVGPILLDLPLGAGASRQFTVAIDTGSFSKIEFEVHKPGSSDDAGFIALHPEFDGVSIKMTGTWNGTPFTYTSDLDVEQEIDLVPPLSVTESTGANLTLFVDLASWFANAGNTGLIDPATANKGGAAEGEVKSNIETSLNAFEDDDHDGEDDHGAN